MFLVSYRDTLTTPREQFFCSLSRSNSCRELSISISSDFSDGYIDPCDTPSPRAADYRRKHTPSPRKDAEDSYPKIIRHTPSPTSDRIFEPIRHTPSPRAVIDLARQDTPSPVDNFTDFQSNDHDDQIVKTQNTFRPI